MRRNSTISHLLGEQESLSRSQPIRNKNAKGKNTAGMVQVKLLDENNTVIFFENQQEADRVLPFYKTKMAAFGSGKTFTDTTDNKLINRELKEATL